MLRTTRRNPAKAKLKIAVDTLIPQVNSFEELLSRLQGLGYNDTRISAVGAEGASVGTIANAANGATFTVTSESSNNVSVYTIKATYADAITSFSVNGVEGVISDSEDPKDNIPDTITVTLPRPLFWISTAIPLWKPSRWNMRFTAMWKWHRMTTP